MKPDFGRALRMQSIYTKLLLTLLLVIVPLYGTNLLINRLGAEQNREEIAKSLQIRVHAYLERLELETFRIQALQREFLNDAELLKLSSSAASMNEYEKVHAILQLQQRLQNLKVSSQFVLNTSIYLPQLSRTVETTKYQTTVQEEELRALQSQNSVHSLSVFKGGLYAALSAQPAAGGALPPFLIATKLDLDHIHQTLEQMAEPEGGLAALVATSPNVPVAGKVESDTLTLIQQALQHDHGEDVRAKVDLVKLNNGSYLTAFEHSQFLGLTLYMIVPEERILGTLKRYEHFFWIISALSIVIVAFLSYWVYRLIHQPLLRLVQAFRKLEEGDLTVSVTHRQKDEFGYLYTRFNSMVNRLNVLIQEVYEGQIRSQRSELKRLQSQINPHFLYNSHFILSRLIRGKDYENAFQFSMYLGEYLQFITRDAKDELPLEQEVKHARSYCEIQSICFSGRIRVDFADLPEAARFIPVPRLILQPVIENAYKYGLENRLSDGLLRIRMEESSHECRIIIEDNGDDLEDTDIATMRENLLDNKVEDAERSGLVNIHRRLQIRYGPHYGLTFSRSELGGLKVVILIPNEKELDASHAQIIDRR